MNTNDPWKRLANAASRHRIEPDTPAEMPFGFDTRVLAHLRPPRQMAAELLSRLAFGAIPFAAALLMACWFTVQPDAHGRTAVADPAALADEVFAEEAIEP
ncbi:MAG: hypothetical protein NTY01_22070 [Verrucomicrobia bacterium]|nr:hypothetical protein [Verrucomicrobiota bacterium]